MLRTEDVEGWVTVRGVRRGTCVKQHNCHADHPWRRTVCCLDRGRPPTPRRVRKVTQELRRKDLTRQSVGAGGRGGGGRKGGLGGGHSLRESPEAEISKDVDWNG